MKSLVSEPASATRQETIYHGRPILLLSNVDINDNSEDLRTRNATFPQHFCKLPCVHHVKLRNIYIYISTKRIYIYIKNQATIFARQLSKPSPVRRSRQTVHRAVGQAAQAVRIEAGRQLNTRRYNEPSQT